MDGWTQTTTTTHTYDENGRVTRSVTTVDSEWDDEQSTIMVALHRYRQDTCHGCGGHLPDTTHPDADDDYVVGVPVRCHRCTAIGQAVDRHRDSPQPHALMYPATRRNRPTTR